MKKIFVAMAAGVCSLAMFAAQAQAGLVQVVIDNFTATTVNPGSTTTLTGGAGSVTRTQTGGINIGSSIVAVLAGDALTLDYAGQFNDIFNLYKGGVGSPNGTINPNPSDTAVFSGFQVNISTNNIAGGTISDGITTYSLGTDANQSFRFFGYGAADTAFSVTIGGFTGGNVAMTSVSAVPEPSALLLVGSVLGLGYAKRRRR